MRETMREAGPTITLTSLTDFVAFAVGSTIDVPAIQAFCATAAISVLAVFVLQCTLFAPCLVLDTLRQQSNRYDVCCCWQAKQAGGAEEDQPSVDQQGSEPTPPDDPGAQHTAEHFAEETISNAGGGVAPSSIVAAIDTENPLSDVCDCASPGACFEEMSEASTETSVPPISPQTHSSSEDDNGSIIAADVEEVTTLDRPSQQPNAADATATEAESHTHKRPETNTTHPLGVVCWPATGSPARAGGARVPTDGAADSTAQATAFEPACIEGHIPPLGDKSASCVVTTAPTTLQMGAGTLQVQVGDLHLQCGSSGSQPIPVSNATHVPDADSDDIIRAFIRKTYAPFLLWLPVRAAVVVLFIAGAVWGGFNAAKAGKGLDSTDYLPEDSYLIDFYDARERFFGQLEDTAIWVLAAGSSVPGVSQPAAIYNSGYVAPDDANDFTWARRLRSEATPGAWTNWGAPEHRSMLDRVHSRMTTSVPGLRLPVFTWYMQLVAWETNLPPQQIASAGVNATTFASHVMRWLETDPQAAQFAGDLAFANAASGTVLLPASQTEHTQPTILRAMQLKADVARPSDSAVHVQLMMHIRGVTQGLYGPQSLTPQQLAATGFGFEWNFLWLERYRIIDRLAVQNLLFAAASVLGCLLLFHPPSSAFIVLLVVVMVDVDILGTMYAWGITLNVASIVNLIMAIGFSVDFR